VFLNVCSNIIKDPPYATGMQAPRHCCLPHQNKFDMTTKQFEAMKVGDQIATSHAEIIDLFGKCPISYKKDDRTVVLLAKNKTKPAAIYTNQIREVVADWVDSSNEVQLIRKEDSKARKGFKSRSQYTIQETLESLL